MWNYINDWYIASDHNNNTIIVQPFTFLYHIKPSLPETKPLTQFTPEHSCFFSSCQSYTAANGSISAITIAASH